MRLRLMIGCTGLIVYLLCILIFGGKARAADNLNRRLERIRSSDRFGAEADSELSLPFAERIFRPAFTRLIRTMGNLVPLSKKAQTALSESLRSAGIAKSARDYLATLELLYVLIALAAVIVCRLVLHWSLLRTVFILLFALLVLYTLARFRLKKCAAQRSAQIENDMPEILDLLSVSVSAGLGFDQALQYVVERCDGVLASELAVTQREIRLGKSRIDALKGLAERGRAEALRMFVSAVTQADTLGIAISNILQVQAESNRTQHKQRIEEKAAKLPVKVLLPLVLCIFPVIFIILLGPAVPKVMAAL